MDIFAEMTRRYAEGDVPWDAPLPPPEVLAFAATAAPGHALDLGCGPGRTSIYLAQHGWTCDGIDFVAAAIAQANARAQAAGVAERVRFSVGSVTQLDDARPPYDLAVDIGCMHNLRGDPLRAYASEVARVLRPGGVYLLFAFIASAGALTAADERLTEQDIRDLFSGACVIERVAPGSTTVGGVERPSAWFWMRRRAHA